jgi:SRSO17 transposase
MLPACRTAGDLYEPPPLALTPEDVEGFIDELRRFHARFRHCFGRSEPRDHFFRYMMGQVSSLERKSIEPIALETQATSIRAMHRSLSDTEWDDAQMRRTYPHLVSEDLGERDGVVMVDESGFAKKGKDSVGVARQYCGSLGKVDNCQVGGFAGYASRQGYALVDTRLFLPEPWFTADYASRRAMCGVPTDTTFQSKPQLAATRVRDLYDKGVVPFRYIVADCLYGNSPAFWSACEACVGTVAFVAIPEDTRAWLAPVATDSRTYRYRGEERLKREVIPPDTPAASVAELARQLGRGQWSRRTVAEGTKGPIAYECARRRVTLCKEGPPPQTLWLVIKRTLGDNPTYWYYISNAPVSTPLSRFVWLSGIRWAIEQCFGEAKTELGMAHYELRKFAGWHHHMWTCMLAHFFLWHMKIRLGEKSSSAYGVAGPVAVGGGVAPENLPVGRRLAVGAMDPAAQSRGLSRASQTARRRGLRQALGSSD